MKRIIVSDSVCVPIQKMVFKKMGGRAVNTFNAPETKPRVRDDGVLYVNDVRYGEKYPNSFLDIWYPDSDTSAKRPTLIYFHGGGFIFGDKIQGDPMAADSESFVSVFLELLKNGYNIVSATYALAPKYRFPVQIEQVNEVVGFLDKNRDKYRLDMDNVILMGGSAGACMVEIYGLVLSDSDYAAELGIVPQIRKEQIKALIIDEAAIIGGKFENNNMNMMFQTWMGTNDLDNCEAVKLTDVASRVNENYIPSFINTSNLEPWFVTSAAMLRDALEKHGVEHEYFYRDQSVDKLEHGYVNRFATNQCAKECLESMLSFMRSAMCDKDRRI